MEIRNSAKAIIVHENKLLVTKFEDKDGVYYLLPGGGQNAGETIQKTIQRECLEEVGLQVEVGDLAFVRECFIDKGIHRVEFIFNCHLEANANVIGVAGTSLDNHQTGVGWIPLDDLRRAPLFPMTLRELIIQHNDNKSGFPIYIGVIQ